MDDAVNRVCLCEFALKVALVYTKVSFKRNAVHYNRLKFQKMKGASQNSLRIAFNLNKNINE